MSLKININNSTLIQYILRIKNINAENPNIYNHTMAITKTRAKNFSTQEINSLVDLVLEN